ncbi:MAG: AAA family ATPase [Candidatus Moraniibacteriota bacterium]|nr:MAG: AAA family ATPase [Candidatus Moranbacteria bacterium]
MPSLHDQSFSSSPLADRMRPRRLEELVGQSILFEEGAILRVAQKSGVLPSLILWGPPGVGKTTLALLLSQEFDAEFVSLSAVGSGVKELRSIVSSAQKRQLEGKKTILFVDEVHRWNKSQQDALLPHVETGTLTLIGATTENPSFEMNSALLSRLHVIVLSPLSKQDILSLLRRSLSDTERGLGSKMSPPIPRRSKQLRNPQAVMPEPLSMYWKWRRARDISIPGRCEPFSCALPFPMIGKVTSTISTSLRFTSRFAGVRRARRSIGSRACSRQARIRSSSRGVWCDLLRKT